MRMLFLQNQECVFHLLSKVARAGSRRWQSEMEQHGLTAVQAKVLIFMQDLSQPTSQQLGEYCGLDAASLTGVVDRLIKLDFLQRIPDLKDRRVNRIDYTKTGKTLAKKIKQKQEPANLDFMTKLSEKEQKQLRNLLHKLDN